MEKAGESYRRHSRSSRSEARSHRHDQRETERERERSRRSRSRWERERERERSRRSRSRSERIRRHDDDEDDQKYSRERRYGEMKDEAPQADPARDQRSVFAYQLSLKADERDIFKFFSRAGKVRNVHLIMDRNSRRSKGVGYIEFDDVMSVPMAIALSGQLLHGQPVVVKPSEAEKNMVRSNTTTGANSGVARRLYIGNLHLNITEDQLRQVFGSFGEIEFVQLPLDPLTGHCKGYGFVQFASLEDAKDAQSFNGQLEIAGRIIKVSLVTDQTRTQDVTINAADFGDEEDKGLCLRPHSRALLMRKLEQTGTSSSFFSALPAPVVDASLPAAPTAPVLGVSPLTSCVLQPLMPAPTGLPASGLQVASISTSNGETVVATECLLLKNMFDPSLETEPDFDLDIKEDVEDECSKFGIVKHIYVDKKSAGFVYLHFDSVAAAMKAQSALQGRWFAGKMIIASFLLPQHYEAKFANRS